MKFFVFTGLLLSCLPCLSKAQLCTGNLGDPIVNIDFGPQNFTLPLPAGATSYNYAGGCPSAGEYSVSSLLFGCDNNNWFLLAGDHTHNTNGRYMVINAESFTGNVYVTTASGLCANTTYQFAAWVMNVVKNGACGGNTVLPNLTFIVETVSGTVLATYNTGNIPQTNEKTWNQYGLFFTTPANISSLVLRIKSNANGACGNAFAIDDITLKACGPPVVATLDGQNISYIDVCAGYSNPFILHATYPPVFTDPVMIWQNSIDTGKTWIDIPGANTTTYSIPVRNFGVILYRMAIAERINFNSPQCRIASNSIWTNVHPLPDHQPTTDLTGCLNKDFILTDPTYVLKFHWAGPNGFQSDFPTPTIPKVQYKDSGLYTVILTADFGCTIRDSFRLKIYPSSTVSVMPVHSICEGTSVNLSATGGGSYKWTPAIGLSNDTIANPLASPKDSIQYKVLITNSYGCKDSALVNINVYRLPAVNAGPDKIILKGDSAVLNASVKGTAVNFYWSPPVYMDDSHLINPKVYPPADLQYTLNAISTVGCGTTVSYVTVKVYNDIYIPNAFTPNGDGKNDKFRILAFENYKLIKLVIYNRWGVRVFQAANTYNGWDGKFNGVLQPMGAYVYNLELEGPSGKRIVKQGTILLLQ